MIIDLCDKTHSVNTVKTDVCIVGAGAAGLFLAELLNDKGINSIVLEAGNMNAKSASEKGMEIEQIGNKYNGAEFGRSFGLGGTSVLWGGQMIPVTKSDISKRSDIGFDAWPISYNVLKKYFSKVLDKLDLIEIKDSLQANKYLKSRFGELVQACVKSDFNLRVSQWIPFKKRNFSQAFSNTIKNKSSVTIWINANVVKIKSSDIHNLKSIDSVVAKSDLGNKVEVRSLITVICAGALESTRIILQLDKDYENFISKCGAPVGNYFSDHLSVTCGRFKVNDLNSFNMAFAPIFQDGIMRSPRLELKSIVQKQKKIPSAFIHFIFTTSGNSGLDIIRNFIRNNQGKQTRVDLSPKSLHNSINDIFKMTWWYLRYKRLWIPSDAVLTLQVDTEQLPNKDSRLLLSNDIDKFGRNKLIVDWQVTNEDFQTIRNISLLSSKFWKKSSLSKIANLKLFSLDGLKSIDKPYDVYHPTGSLRMGTSISESVVNLDLKLWNTENCYVSSTAVFPSAGSANPGLTHLALTARLADHIEEVLK